MVVRMADMSDLRNKNRLFAWPYSDARITV